MAWNHVRCTPFSEGKERQLRLLTQLFQRKSQDSLTSLKRLTREGFHIHYDK